MLQPALSGIELSLLYIIYAIPIPSKPISTEGIAITNSISLSKVFPSDVTSLLKGIKPVTSIRLQEQLTE
jgi:hypothetical protein